MTQNSKASNWSEILGSALGLHVSSFKEKRLCSLWAGYGYVSALSVSLEKIHSNEKLKGPHYISDLVESSMEAGRKTSRAPCIDLIVKQVTPPRDTGIGHERKIHSYEVESQWYLNHVPMLMQQKRGSAPSVPLPLHISSQSPTSFTFVLSDLRKDFPISLAKGDLGSVPLKAALTWLAQLHACFWEVPSDTLSDLWLPQGSYWHLDTRQEELEMIGREWSGLKSVAVQLDDNLKGKQPDGSFSDQHMTVCHGDFKSPNLLFSDDSSRCAAFDFQYIGRSFGARDIAYLFCSSADEEVLNKPGGEEQLLSHYHSELMKFLSIRCSVTDAKSPLGTSYTFEVLQKHYEWALMDFIRFMAGWGMFGAARWGSRRVRELLDRGL